MTARTPTPVLRTNRTSLVPFSEAEHLTDRYVSWLNDAEVVRFSEQRHCRHDLDSCRAFVRGFTDAGHNLWAIIAENQTLGHIGNITATLDPPNRLADVAILLGERAAWGRGLGTEAWGAVCGWLIDGAGIRKVSAGTLADNHAMLKIMERAGMIPDGRRAAHYLVDGQPVDMVYAALFAEARDLNE